MSDAVNVRDIMQQIRARIRERSAASGPDTPGAEAEDPEIADLAAAVGALRLRLAAVGELPVQPPTLRGRTGALLIRAVRRTLFWYTPPLRNAFTATVDAFDWQTAAIARLAADNREYRRILEEIRAELAELSAEVGRIGIAAGEGKSGKTTP
jgi:hypothetical protein